METAKESPINPAATPSRGARWMIGAATAVGVGVVVGIALLQSKDTGWP